tara:strand:+ start:2089 stop:2319 length:231 start_codon:yes stop_codon:yes gene_type:complete
VKITEVIENVFRKKGWAIYDKQDPIQKLPLSGETPLFKVNEVELRYLLKDIKQTMEEETWKKSNLDGNQQNTSQIG